MTATFPRTDPTPILDAHYFRDDDPRPLTNAELGLGHRAVDTVIDLTHGHDRRAANLQPNQRPYPSGSIEPDSDVVGLAS